MTPQHPAARVLITGFEPFDGMSENISATLVEHLRQNRWPDKSSCAIRLAVLPVSYGDADVRLESLLQDFQPDTVLAFGIGQGTSMVTIERIAVNIDDAENCDNCGETRTGATIEHDAPAAYFATVPVERIHAELLAADIDASISNHAGAFLCNHVLFRLLHRAATYGHPINAGFFHLPRIAWNRAIAIDLERAVAIIASASACTQIRSC